VQSLSSPSFLTPSSREWTAWWYYLDGHYAEEGAYDWEEYLEATTT